jgi:hypothetical protein
VVAVSLIFAGTSFSFRFAHFISQSRKDYLLVVCTRNLMAVIFIYFLNEEILNAIKIFVNFYKRFLWINKGISFLGG